MDAFVQVVVEKLTSLAGDKIGCLLSSDFENELKNVKSSLEMIHAFLQDASKRNLEESRAVKLWLKNLENVAYEADNLLDEFNYEINRRKAENPNEKKRKLFSFSFSFSFFLPDSSLAFRLKMADKIKDVDRNLKMVNEQASMYGLQVAVAGSSVYVPPVMETSSITVDPIVLGRDDDALKIINMILESRDEAVSVVPIFGMGGLGKTTLARKVFKDNRIDKHFDNRIWVSLSKKLDEKDVFAKILESLTKESVRIAGEEAILRQLQSKLKNRRYLLILDDYLNVTVEEWNSFMNCLYCINGNKGNFIIVTTRDQKVASIVTPRQVSCLGSLSDDDSWSIIKARAFPGNGEVPEDFEAIGKEIACRCRGLPLAANVVGGSLRGKRKSDWDSILQNGFSMSNPNDDFVLQVLKVSFDRLPSPFLKKCFAYCAIFSKGAEMERNRLIQLWMAEGLLLECRGVDMESQGNNVFNVLLQNFFLHEAITDEYDNIDRCKMHDLVHDLSRLVSNAEIYSVENHMREDIPQVRYLAIRNDDNEYTQEIAKEKASFLRTLLVRHNVPNNVFQDCSYLRVLDLQKSLIRELTSSVDKLIHLKFLDLSFTHIRTLPDSVCKLFSLQTLRLLDCIYLKDLPDQLCLLVSLRHLVIGMSLRKMPLGIGKLSCLRTLELFVVGKGKDSGISELGYLKNIHGKLKIQNLENVSGGEESLGACLIDKQNIQKLVFSWMKSSEGNNNHEEVLGGLQPHPNIKSLSIENFCGDNFPSWIMRMMIGEGLRLDNLVEIVLIGCEKCQKIPTLGHLPLLKVLKLDGLKNIRSLGHSFYHSQDFNESSSNGIGQIAPSVLFPALKRFVLFSMSNLEEWVEVKKTEASAAAAFPNLEYLEIFNCYKIMTAPTHEFQSLKEMRIILVDSGVLAANICSKASSLEKVLISKNSNLTCLPNNLFHNNLQLLNISFCDSITHLEFPEDAQSIQSLEELIIAGCQNLATIQYPYSSHLLGFSSLVRLEIRECRELITLPSKMLDSCMSLQAVKVVGCTNLISFPVNWQRMPHLTSLNISLCPKLRSLPKGIGCLTKLIMFDIGPFSEETNLVSFLKIFEHIHELRSLHTLSLMGKPHWDSLPHQLQHLGDLITHLSLDDFGIESLPEWFSSMSGLKRLEVSRCEKLRHLLSLQHLNKLEELKISQCTLLSEKLTRGLRGRADRSQWPEISHIHKVYVNDELLQFHDAHEM